MQGFVKHTAVRLYSLKQVWEHSSAHQGILSQVKQDARLAQELARSQLPLSVRQLLPGVLASVQALVDSLKVSSKSWRVGGWLQAEGAWGSLGHL